MARYPFRLRGGQKNWMRNPIYIILVLLIIAVVIVFLRYRPANRSTDSNLVSPNDIGMPGANEAIPLVSPKPTPEPNLIEIPVPASKSNPKVEELINEAVAMVNTEPSRIIEARDRLNELLPMPMSPEQQVLLKNHLSQLANQWLFSRSVFPDDKHCSSYEVKTGDKLQNISRQFKVPWEILLEINHIPRPEALRSGQTIKVIHGPFHARIYRSTFTMDLYLQNTYVRSFPVGLGEPGRQTPTGLWIVKPGGKLISPPWTDPDTHKVYHPGDPNYPLGSCWIELEGIEGEAKGKTGFGIHGTKEPGTIGTASSRGCIRLHNGDAKFVYNLLVPGLSRVEVVP